MASGLVKDQMPYLFVQKYFIGNAKTDFTTQDVGPHLVIGTNRRQNRQKAVCVKNNGSHTIPERESKKFSCVH